MCPEYKYTTITIGMNIINPNRSYLFGFIQPEDFIIVPNAKNGNPTNVVSSNSGNDISRLAKNMGNSEIVNINMRFPILGRFFFSI